jgi:hypothetical protein
MGTPLIFGLSRGNMKFSAADEISDEMMLQHQYRNTNIFGEHID